MKSLSGHRPRRQQLLFLLSAVVPLTLLVLEAVDAGSWQLFGCWLVSGGVPLAALYAPRDRFTAVAATAVPVSFLMTLVGTRLTHRPEHTFGFVEAVALLLLVARALWQQPLPRAAALAAGATLAAGSLFLRLEPSQYSVTGGITAAAALFAGALMVVLGLCLRLLDTLRAREHEAGLQAQRLQYARELHDFVAHHVTAIVAQTKAVRFTTAAGMAPGPEELDRSLAGIERAGSQAMESMRGMVTVLRDTGRTAPADRGLDGLRALTADFSAAGPPATLALDPRLADADGTVPAEVTAVAHHVVREALTNIRKHARETTCVTVDVRKADDGPRPLLRVSVTDDGAGAGPDADVPERDVRAADAAARRAGKESGFGLTGLAERVEALGGRLTAGRRAGAGWTVGAELPLTAAPHGDAPRAGLRP